MDRRTEELVQKLYAEPQNRAALDAVRAHLGRNRRFRSLAKVLEWWARKAPTDQDAADALVEASEAVSQSGTDPERAFELANKALERVPGHDGATRFVESRYVEAGDVRGAISFLEAQERAVAAEAGDGLVRATLIRRVARLQADALDDRDSAIASYEAAVALGLDDIDVARELGQLLVDRADERGPVPGKPDRRRAAQLYTRFARGLDDESAVQWLEAALDLAPDDEEALSVLEALVPDVDSDTVLPRRWVRFIVEVEDGPSTDARRARLAKRYIAAGRLREAIACLEPMAAKGQRKVTTAIDRLQKRLTERGSAPEPAPTDDLPALPGAELAEDDLSRMSLLADLRAEHARDAALHTDDDSLPAPPESDPPAQDAPTRLHDPAVLAAAARSDDTDIDDFLNRLGPPHSAAPAAPATPVARVPSPAARGASPAAPRAGRGGRRTTAGVQAAQASSLAAFEDDAPTVSLAEELEGETSGVSRPDVRPATPEISSEPRAVQPVREPRPADVMADAPAPRREPAPPPDGFEPFIVREPEEEDDEPPPDHDLDDLFAPAEAPAGELDAPVVQIVRSAQDHVVDDVTLRTPGTRWKRRSAPFAVQKPLRGGGATVVLKRAAEGNVYRAGDGTPEALPPGAGKVSLSLGDEAVVYDEGLVYRVKVHRPPVVPNPVATRSEWREHAVAAASSFALHMALILAAVFGAVAGGVDLKVEDRPTEEIFAEIRQKPPEERPKPPPPPERPRPVQRIKQREPDPPEPQVRIPESLSKKLKQISRERSSDSADSTSRALSALTSPNPGGGESLGEVVSNIDAVAGGDASGAFRIGGTLSALEGTSGVNIASSGGGEVGTLGGQVATKNTTKVEGRTGRVRGRVRGVRALTRVTGSLSQGEVLAAINRKIGQIQACYERAMTRSGQQLSGQIAYQWTVTTSGSVSGLRETSNTLGDRSVSSCVSGVLRGVRFPRPAGGPAEVRFPFMFQPSN